MSIQRPYALLALVLAAFAAREGAGWYHESKLPSGAYLEVFGHILVLPPGYTFSVSRSASNDGFAFVPYHLKTGKVIAGPYSALSSGFHEWRTKNTTKTEERCGVHVIHLTDQGTTSTLVHDSKEYVLFTGVPSKDIEFSLAAFCRVGRTA